MDAAKTLAELKRLAALQRKVAGRIAAWEQTHGAMGEPEPAEPGAAPAEPPPATPFTGSSPTSYPQV